MQEKAPLKELVVAFASIYHRLADIFTKGMISKRFALDKLSDPLTWRGLLAHKMPQIKIMDNFHLKILSWYAWEISIHNYLVIIYHLLQFYEYIQNKIDVLSYGESLRKYHDL